MTMFSILKAVVKISGVFAFICFGIWIFTTIQFHLSVRNQSKSAQKDKPIPPPLFPYAVPGLGSTIQFSNSTIGSFWEWLRKQSNRYDGIGAFSIILSGKRTYFIFSPAAISAAFRSRQLSRNNLDRQLGVNALGMSKEDAAKAFPAADPDGHMTTHAIHADHLLQASAVNNLTSKYMDVFQGELNSDESLKDGVEVELYFWLRDKVFVASSTALCGSRLLEMHPDLDTHFWKWEEGMLGLLFGKPRLFAQKAYAARDALLERLSSWLEDGYSRKAPTDDPEWEPTFGTRVMRKRHEFYKQQQLSINGQAGSDLIFLAGILTNATPATGWLLLHILSPTNNSHLYPRIMTELKSVQRDDGSIDITALTRLPLLTSAFNETLRLYVDLLVVRQVDSDVAIGNHQLHKDEMIMMPTWMTHRDPEFFPKPNEFDPDRFIVADEDTGERSNNKTGLVGRYFPFGRGSYMCPGRNFAKQEVLGTVATLLLNYDVSFVEYAKSTKTGYEGIGTDSTGFPSLKKNYAGNQVIGIEGDMRVRIKRKQQA